MNAIKLKWILLDIIYDQTLQHWNKNLNMYESKNKYTSYLYNFNLGYSFNGGEFSNKIYLITVILIAEWSTRNNNLRFEKINFL